MHTNEEIRLELQRIFEIPVDIQRYNEITHIARNKRWCDAVTAGGLRNARAATISPDDEPHAYIANRLAHIIVNPSNRKTDVTALIETYVYSEALDSVNNNKDGVKRFLENLCDLSTRKREAFLRDRHRKRDKTDVEKTAESVKLLVGEKGVGKTFFLNHILARHSDDLDKKKIIWVRLNLVDSFGDKNRLIPWIYAQAAKIILRYYCDQSNYFDNRSGKHKIEVLSFVRRRLNDDKGMDPEVKRQMVSALENMRQVFVQNVTDEPITPDLVPEYLARLIWASAVEDGGYSFIIVLDGMDRLESSAESHEKFRGLISQLATLYNGTVEIPASFVLVCRRKTADRLASANIDPFFVTWNNNRHEIGEVDFKEVIGQRVNYLINQLPKFPDQVTERDETVKENLRTFYSHVKERGVELSMFGKNMRATLHAVQLRYKEFLLYGSHEHHDYKWIESCVKMGWLFPPKIYRYKAHSNQNNGASSKDLPYDCIKYESLYDNLLVSIFHYPHLEYDDQHARKRPHFKNCLIGLRVLQVATSSSNLIKNQSIRDKVDVECLCELLSELFGYETLLTRSVIRELSEFELIDTEGEQLHPSNRPIDKAPVGIAPKGEYVLDHCIPDVAYLGMCAMRIPMNADIFTGDKPPFFSASTFRCNGKDTASSSDLGGWVRTKTINSMNLYKLLEYLDRSQLESIERKIESRDKAVKVFLDNAQQHKSKIFKQFFELAKSKAIGLTAITPQVAGMLESITDSEDSRKEIISFLAKNSRAWWE